MVPVYWFSETCAGGGSEKGHSTGPLPYSSKVEWSWVIRVRLS